MVSPFEAALLGFVALGPVSRYGVMKLIRSQSLYWSGSPGAVYSALGRLEEKGLIGEVGSNDPKLYEMTELGFEAALEFLKTPVPAEKLVLDPGLIRMKLRGLQDFSPTDRTDFYVQQLDEYSKAVLLVMEKQGTSGKKINQELSALAVAQLRLEADFIRRLLAQELG